MGATGSDESSQNSRGEHCGLFLWSVEMLSPCNLSENNYRTLRPYYPVLPGVHLFIVLEDGKEEMPDSPAKQSKLNAI